VGFAFSTVTLYAFGALLQRVWAIGFWPAIAVGFSLGLSFGGLWFFLTHSQNPMWFSLGLLGALVSAFLFRKRSPLTFQSTGLSASGASRHSQPSGDLQR